MSIGSWLLFGEVRRANLRIPWTFYWHRFLLAVNIIWMTELPLYSLSLRFFWFLCSTLLCLNVLFICRVFLGRLSIFLHVRHNHFFLRGIVSLQLFLVIPRSFDPAVPDTIKALLATTLVSDQLGLQPPLWNLVWTNCDDTL